MIGNAPCRLEVEREVSEGCGLGEERLGRWCTEEREESGGADQISLADGASVLGRATRRLAQEGGVRLRWLGSGREGKGQNGDGTVADVRFEKKISSVARAERGEKGGSAWARPRGGGRRRKWGPIAAVGSVGRPATPPTSGRGRRHCHANRVGRRAWTMRRHG
jgi:hypothetical protein